jgi:C-terminal processing protease CtpA/Prc
MDCQVPEFTRHIYKNKFYHSGDLGDLMYSLSTIKALGGGTLVLSQDYNGMEIREPMTATKIEQVKKLLQTQDYIVSVEHAPTNQLILITI